VRISGLSEKHIVGRLRDEGWSPSRVKGSHQQWYHPRWPHRRVTTTPKMTVHIKRSVFRQAGWNWGEDDENVSDELKRQCTELARENEELRKSLLEMLEMMEALTEKRQDAS